MRIVSLLPSATDIVAALGAGEDLVGVSHSCSGDWGHLPRLTGTWLDLETCAEEIDRQVREAREPLYRLDIATLERLDPDVIVSQSLCDVCAVPSGDVLEAVHALPGRPALVDLAPNTLDDVPLCIEQVGKAIGRSREAARRIDDWNGVLDRHRGRFADSGLRIAFLDWVAPPFVAGHWVPDMLALLGLTDVLGRSGQPSFAVTWEAVEASRPDLVIAACCGFDAERASVEEVRTKAPVRFLDGHCHFSRPSPALLPSLALLAQTVQEFADGA